MFFGLKTLLAQLFISLSIIVSLVQHGAFSQIVGQAVAGSNQEYNLPQGYVAHPNINVAYKLHRERQRWSSAKDTCESEGGRLAIIDTATKLTYVKEAKSPLSEAWVGLSKEDDKWVDVNNNPRQDDLPWQEGAPDSFGFCAAVNVIGDGLCNKLCIWRKPFVCERALG